MTNLHTLTLSGIFSMSFFIQPAMAETAPPAGDPFSFIFLIGFALIFYFLIWRPQSKRTKAHKKLMESISKNDEVSTNGGLLGKVVKVSDDFIVLNVAENTDIKLQKMAITSILPKGTLKDI